jgi:hypothetical protein
MTHNPEVQQLVQNILQGTGTCEPSGMLAQTVAPNQADDPVNQQAHYLMIRGSEAVQITDALGHSTPPITETNATYVPGVTYHMLSEQSHAAILPTNQVYTVTFSVGENPLFLELATRTTALTTTQAIRYRDLSLPAGSTAMFKLTPLGMDLLRYDSDGDGTPDTPVEPTVALAGGQAQDMEAPEIQVNTSGQGASTMVSITARDMGVGVKAVLYSLDGTHYQPYNEPIQVDPVQTPILYVFADDQVANRSELITYPLGTVGVQGISINGARSANVDADTMFVAQVEPITATVPMSYTWEATDHTPQTHSGDLRDSIILNWDTVGTKTITVTATNAGATVSATSTVELFDRGAVQAQQQVYLPLIQR